ncbi:hypothetical protein QI7_3593 [Clostridioides difficile 6042]|nr:hypothetical protein QAO_3147 [Clostridioides difficile CD3]EQF85650.1 hypothetical protein QGU_3098 [Clostridioides difficile 655]EQG10801.1 hypothetical protein QI7_3593 [Clostridioides difficile 6042]EQI16372.1 hypothetical protein QOK_3287 [Clostridioides difficile Y41]EQI20052.1 hypothetical protein QOM_2999 [Clostridioides difficile Y155]EQI56071.1 hypothetical protein QQ9_3176 [Clostridioides difficile Y312]EQJ70810.1 hypothetical protein QSY_3140 [Clostridioides difficile P36]
MFVLRRVVNSVYIYNFLLQKRWSDESLFHLFYNAFNG